LITEDGKIYIDGVLRLVGPKGLVIARPGGLLEHPLAGTVMRLESPPVPIDDTNDKTILESQGFFRSKNGVWRQLPVMG